jgi:hypothetical protein
MQLLRFYDADRQVPSYLQTATDRRKPPMTAASVNGRPIFIEVAERYFSTIPSLKTRAREMAEAPIGVMLPPSGRAYKQPLIRIYGSKSSRRTVRHGSMVATTDIVEKGRNQNEPQTIMVYRRK